MANTIRIKRRSSDATAPTTSQAVNAELAFNENNDILYYGKGGNSSASSSVIKIGGSGAFLTLDTNQTPTGVKTFSTTTLAITGGSNGNVLTTNGSGTLSWSSISASAYANISDGTTTAAASGADTIRFRTSGPLTAAVGSNDPTFGDNLLLTVGTMAIANGGTGHTSYTNGDLLTYNSASSTTNLTKLGIGTNGHFLKVNSGLPAWSALTSGEVTTALSYTPVNKAGDTLTGFLTLHSDPSSALHAATKQYVDGVAQGLHVHATADAATTARLGSLAGVAVSYSSGTQAITWTGGTAANAAGFTDGLTLTASTTEASASRLLVKNEGDASGLGAAYNGTYYVYGARELRRTTDGNTAADFAGGDFCFVTAGTLYEATGWVQTEEVVTLDTTPIIWQQFSGAGAITAGNGLTQSGTTINVGTASAARIVVNANDIDLASVSYSPSIGSAGINFVQSATVDTYGRVSAASYADVRTGSTSQTGILQLTDSTSSTSTTTAATPASVKSAYDLANAALPKAGGTMTGKIIGVTATTSIATFQIPAGASPSLPVSGDFWNVGGTLKFYNGSATKDLAFTDSNITGTAANVTGTVAIANGGTGATTKTVAFDNLSPLTTLGDTIYHDGTDNVRLAGNTTSTKQFLSQTGNGTVSAVPSWSAVSKSDVGLANVENTALSTWAGSANITTLGTVATGTWNAATIATNKGGTGLTSFTSGGAVYATSTSVLTTGTLPVSAGGTGVATLTGIVKASGTSAFSAATAGTDYVVGGTTTVGKIIAAASSSGGAGWQLTSGTDPSSPASGDLWNASGTLKLYNGSATKTIAFTDSNITGTAANVTGTVAVANGGTGATSFTANGILYGNTTSAVQVTSAGTWDGTNSVGQLLSVNSAGTPTFTNTVDGGGY